MSFDWYQNRWPWTT